MTVLQQRAWQLWRDLESFKRENFFSKSTVQSNRRFINLVPQFSSTETNITWTTEILLDSASRTTDRLLNGSGHDHDFSPDHDVAVLVVTVAGATMRREQLSAGRRLVQGSHRAALGAPIL